MRKDLIFTCLSLLSVSQFVRGAEYSITTTWDSKAIDHKPVNITLNRHNATFFKVNVHAQFFNDCSPLGPAGQPFYGLWDYEVVEVFFLNRQNQYVEIELGPHGHHIVLLLNGERKTVRHSLPIDYNKVQRNETDWSGEAFIPIEYLPPNVTKMNAYAIHGTGDERVYESLYPVPQGSVRPDFHNLTAFKEFNSSIILATPVTILSPTWKDSINSESRTLKIVKTWTDAVLPLNETVEIKLSNANDASLIVEVLNAPYYNDSAPVKYPSGPYQNLSDHEVIHLFLLSTTGEYLELQFGPLNHYLVSFWSDYRKSVGNSSFTIKYNVTEWTYSDGTNVTMRWRATASIPLSYLPPNVTKCNAFLAHGPKGVNRSVSALYPAGPGKDYDLHNSSYYRAIDFNVLYPWTVNTTCSSVWNSIYSECGSWTPPCSGAVSYVIECPIFLVSMLSLVLTYVFNF